MVVLGLFSPWIEFFDHTGIIHDYYRDAAYAKIGCARGFLGVRLFLVGQTGYGFQTLVDKRNA
jgi:hypothetical protein